MFDNNQLSSLDSDKLRDLSFALTWAGHHARILGLGRGEPYAATKARETLEKHLQEPAAILGEGSLELLRGLTGSLLAALALQAARAQSIAEELRRARLYPDEVQGDVQGFLERGLSSRVHAICDDVRDEAAFQASGRS